MTSRRRASTRTETASATTTHGEPCARQLVIEVTEHTVVEDYSELEAVLTTLRIGGVRHDPVRRALADCLIRFANQTGTDLIAEGIEEPAELDTWTALGAHAEADDRSRFSGSGLTGAYTLLFYTFWF